MPRYGSADDRRSWSQCAIASREGFDTQLTAAVISTFTVSGRRASKGEPAVRSAAWWASCSIHPIEILDCGRGSARKILEIPHDVDELRSPQFVVVSHGGAWSLVLGSEAFPH